MLPAVRDWHEHHQRAISEMEGRIERGEQLVVAGPALVELYSVLTRLPPHFRLSPTDARALIEANFIDGVETIALDASEYRDLIRTVSDAGIGGGLVYDAVIVACARRARVDALLTFNVRHFERFRSPDLAIEVPA
jgi:predicted nucleic acid-binding protein